MAFDPDSYLAEKTGSSGFNPDAYLAEKTGGLTSAPAPEKKQTLLERFKEKQNAVERLAGATKEFNSSLSNTPLQTIAKLPYGAGEAAANAATGIGSSIVGGLRGLYEGGLSLAHGNGLDAAAQTATDAIQSVQNAGTYQPHTSGGKYLTELVTAPIAGASEVLGYAGNKAGSVVGGKTSAALEGIGESIPAIAGTIAGGRMALRNAPKVQAFASDVADAAKPNISPARADLAQKAKDMGIELRPDQLVTNKYARIAGQVLSQVPFSFSKTDANTTAFGKKLVSLIGGDSAAEGMSHEVYNAAMNKSGGAIGDIAASKEIPLKDLEDIFSSQPHTTPDIMSVIDSYIGDIESSAKNGIVPGTVYREIQSQIGTQMRNTTNGDLKSALSYLQDGLFDALENHLTPAEAEIYHTARKHYAIGKTLEPLMAKSATGEIAPASLMGAVTRNASGKTAMAKGNGGELGDLARIGKEFAEEKTSNTAERNMALRLLTDSSKLAGSAMLIPVAALYNLAGPALTRAMIGAKIPKTGSVQMDHPTRQMFQDAAAKDLENERAVTLAANNAAGKAAGEARGESMVNESIAKRLAREKAQQGEADALRSSGEARGNALSKAAGKGYGYSFSSKNLGVNK